MGRQTALLTHDRYLEGLFLYHRLLAAHKRGLELLKAHLIRRLLHIRVLSSRPGSADCQHSASMQMEI